MDAIKRLWWVARAVRSAACSRLHQHGDLGHL